MYETFNAMNDRGGVALMRVAGSMRRQND